MRKRAKKPRLSKEAREYMKRITKTTNSAKSYKRKFEAWMNSERY